MRATPLKPCQQKVVRDQMPHTVGRAAHISRRVPVLSSSAIFFFFTPQCSPCHRPCLKQRGKYSLKFGHEIREVWQNQEQC